MSRKLLLTSMGLAIEFKDVFLKLLTENPRDLKLAFIITAVQAEPDDLEWYYEDRRRLDSYKIGQVEDLDLKGKTSSELKKILFDKDLIYVEGGNTFYLLKYIRESGFDKLLPELLDQGKLYIGVSAGSIIAGPNIESAGWEFGQPDKNRVGLTDFGGLNLVPFAVIPHFLEDYRKVIEEESKNVSYPLIVLNDEQAILVEGDKYEIVGKGKKIVYNDPKK